ncbi:MAG: DUF805 domain-containing protein [Lentisphaeria bacterium]|nr:DUF805 domain-containing protein [Lentisphaeria bacterium]
MWKYYLQPWKKYLTFAGRATRREFWSFTLVNTLLLWGGMAVLMFPGESGAGPLLIVLKCVFSFFWMVQQLPQLAVTVRRLHDTGCSGWCIFILAVPFLGILLFLIELLLPGTRGRNYFGDDPRAAAPSVERGVDSGE